MQDITVFTTTAACLENDAINSQLKFEASLDYKIPFFYGVGWGSCAKSKIHYILAVHDSHVVGVMELRPLKSNSAIVCLRYIAVCQKFRKKGVSTKLLNCFYNNIKSIMHTNGFTHIQRTTSTEEGAELVKDKISKILSELDISILESS